MKKKRVYIFLAIASIAILAVIRNVQLKRAKAPEYVFTYAENQSEDYPTTKGALKFSELVWEKTSGRIKILVKSGAELGSENEVINQMQYGGIDFARVSIAIISDSIPEMNVLQMPYLYNDSEHMWNVLYSPIGDKFLSLMEEQHLKGLSWYDAGARSFYNTKKPICKPEDLVRMTIRVQESSYMNNVVTELGAKYYNTSYADTYSAIERGVVDGAENNWPSYISSGHYKVAGYFSEDEHVRIPEMQICSEHTWNKLTAQDQRIIMECARLSAEYEHDLWQEEEKKAKQTAKEYGCVINELTTEEKEAFKVVLSELYPKYCGKYRDIIDQIIQVGQNK